MKESRRGQAWTPEEDCTLTVLFDRGATYEEMALYLNRTWFACKCRLTRLGLVEWQSTPRDFLEKYSVPKKTEYNCEKCRGAHTFDEVQLKVIEDWFLSRLSFVNNQMVKLDSPLHCFKKYELQQAKSALESELSKVKLARLMNEEERKKYFSRT